MNKYFCYILLTTSMLTINKNSNAEGIMGNSFNLNCTENIDRCLSSEYSNNIVDYLLEDSAFQAYSKVNILFEGELLRTINIGRDLTSNNILLNLSEINPLAPPPDGSLDCAYDPDHTCEEWDKAARELLERIKHKRTELVVTQKYIDANNETRRIAIALITANAVTKAISKMTKALEGILSPGFMNSLLSVAFNESLTYDNWYYTDLEVGDKLIAYQGTITRIPNSSSGSDNNSDGGDTIAGVDCSLALNGCTNGNDNGGEQPNGTDCGTVYNIDTKGNFRGQWVCVIRYP